MVTYRWPTLFVKLKRCKSLNKDKVLLKLLSKALTGLWTTDRAKTNQMTIPFYKLLWFKRVSLVSKGQNVAAANEKETSQKTKRQVKKRRFFADEY